MTLLAFSDGNWQPQWRTNVDVPEDTFAPGKWVPVRLIASAKTIRAEVAGKMVLEAPMPPTFDPGRGRVGFGAYDDVARFRKLTLDGKPLD